MPVFQSRLKDVTVQSANGIRIECEDNSYLDAISGMFNMIFGYSCDPIINEITNQLKTLPYHPKEHFYSNNLLETANQLLFKTEMEGGGVLFLSSGSEAVEAALAMAIEYHVKAGNRNKRKFITRTHSYHGATLGARSVTGRNYFSEKYAEGYETIKISPPFAVVGENGDEPLMDIHEIEQAINENGAENIAAFIFEPVNHLKGMHQASSSYIRGVRALCSEHNILMITDEIVTGMCRSGPFLNTHLFQVVPDIVLLGKGLSGGYMPVSALVASAMVADCFSPNGNWRSFSYSHTYAASPVAISAVHASLQYLDEVSESNSCINLRSRFQKNIQQLISLKAVHRAESSGLLAGITLCHTLGKNSGKTIENRCFEKGLVIRGEEDWVALVPSFCTSHDELEKIFNILINVISELDAS